MAQITKGDLDGAVRRLNSITKGGYMIDGAYGGWKLVKQVGPGVTDISFGYNSKSETYYAIMTAVRAIEAEQHGAGELGRRGFGRVKLTIR